jgi:hypothetical protein
MNIAYSFIFAFIETTAFARIKLFHLLKNIGAERLVYCDTDSVVFKTRLGANEYMPQTGSFFGDLQVSFLFNNNNVNNKKIIVWMIIQDEVSGKFGDEYRLNRFVSLGSKTYGMELIDSKGGVKHELHCKGINLTVNALKIITFDSLLSLLKDHNSGSKLIVDERYFIQRDKRLSILKSVNRSKKLQFTFKKRRTNFDTFETVPLGYRSV